MKNKFFLILFILALLSALFVIVYLPGYSHYQEISSQEEELLAQIEELNKSNEALENELDLLRNDVTYLEKIVRDRMGLVKPGEVLYKFVEEEPSEE